ncbi:MAG: potassium transporter TrkG [Eubacterium sp.]|uniref:potassium transporter TrkG n=1 Tax=Eubacterium sp. TaxID=142586 RepID=UPI003994B090
MQKGKAEIFAKGLVCVGIGWIALSILGALPSLFQEIPSFVDTLFETVSGLQLQEHQFLQTLKQCQGMLYWRSFSHWLGGMGVLVFLLAIAPADGRTNRFTMHLKGRKSGPDVEKLAPKMRDTALILYVHRLTIVNIIFLLIGKMPLFDSICTAFGTRYRWIWH